MARNRRQSLTDKLPYWGNQNGVVITRQKTVEFAVEFTMPSAAEVTQERREAISALLHQIIIQVVPEHHRIRFIMESGPLNENQMIKVAEGQTTDNELLNYMREENAAIMEKRRQNGALSSWRFFIVVRLDIKPMKFGVPVPYAPQELQRLVRRANNLSSQLVSTLGAGGFEARPLRGQEAFELIWRWYNPAYASSRAPLFKSLINIPNMKQDELRKTMKVYSNSMREQVAESDIDTSRIDCLNVGGRYVQTINVVGSGQRTFAGMSEQLIRRLSGHQVYYIIDLEHLKQAAERKSLNNAAAGAVVNSQDASLGTPDMGNAAVVGNIAATLNRMMSGDEHVFEYGLSIVLIARDREELEYMKEIARTELSQMSGARTVLGTTSNIEQYTKNLAPFSGQNNAYMYKAFSGNVVHFIPCVGPWRGSDKPVALFRSRWGTVTGLNPADGTLNYGTLIVGSAGSGKTFFTQAWATRTASLGADLIVVDQKRDYESFFEALEGQFIPFAPGEMVNGQVVRYNVFELPEGEYEPTEEHKLFLMAFLTALLGGRELDGPERAILTSAIQLAYQNAKTVNNQGEVSYTEVTLGSFVRTMTELNAVGEISVREDLEAQQIIKRLNMSLQTYLGNTVLGSFLDGHSTVRMHNKYLYFDISKMRDDPALMRIALLMVMKQIDRLMRIDPARIKVAIIEEIGVLFQIPEALQFVASLYKLGRAYNLWPVGVTQEINDFRKGQSLINNTSQFIIGKVSAEEARTVVEVLGLKPASLDLIQSLGGQKGVYREYLAMVVKESGMTGDVIQFYPTKTEYWTFTSDPNDKAVRNAAIERHGGNVLEAVKSLTGKTGS